MSSSNTYYRPNQFLILRNAFSSINVPDYFPATPGNTSPDSSNDLTKYLLATLVFSPLHDDPYMEIMQAYDATDNELPIPPLQAPIAPPTVVSPSPVLSLSPMTSTSASPAMTQAAIKKLVADSVSAALEAQAYNKGRYSNPNRSILTSSAGLNELSQYFLVAMCEKTKVDSLATGPRLMTPIVLVECPTPKYGID
ncbi:hypothetical protein Tco_0683425 [Tanacetum coccineum]|uniref:Uncharacterized protein n=1 Tax=Tanacetum coccineum TaxID=301880 RepID=A0ABQ4XVK3_9ASTR